MFERALDLHPVTLLVAFGIAALILAIAAAFAMDVFVGRAERDEPPVAPGRRLPALPTPSTLMAAHADVTGRHAREQVTAR
jgi:hypothetical protein